MTELPLVIVNVQRGGPSTGLPTKTEQSDLMQALYGRSGESPVVVMAASTPADCFDYAYQASKIAIEHMTPVILLTDGYLANDSDLDGLGEATVGAGKGFNIVAYITVSTGIGGVRIVGGKIDVSTYGFEPGHQIIDADGSIYSEIVKKEKEVDQKRLKLKLKF